MVDSVEKCYQTCAEILQLLRNSVCGYLVVGFHIVGTPLSVSKQSDKNDFNQLSSICFIVKHTSIVLWRQEMLRLQTTKLFDTWLLRSSQLVDKRKHFQSWSRFSTWESKTFREFITNTYPVTISWIFVHRERKTTGKGFSR